jgi:hypothetical protein
MVLYKGGLQMVKPKKDDTKKECLKCTKIKRFKEDFYLSNSPNHADGKYPLCKDCIRASLKLGEPLSQEGIDSIKNVLLEMNRPFIFSLYQSSVEESSRKGRELFGIYLKNIILNHKEWTWLDSEFEFAENKSISTTKAEIIDSPEVRVIDNRSKDDVLRMLGYDPFEYESDEDKKQLYNRLVDFLDESTLEDGFKLQAVIEIVKGFNQIDKINHAITNITSDVSKLATNSGGIKSLIDSKKNILASLMKLAEDNGISVKHNNQKSKGAGTLSGIIKTLHEKGIESADINIFNIETCEGMRQVADISNKSILEQLMLNENDYSEMIKDQKELINNYDKRLIELEEENRLIKIKLKHYEDKERMNMSQEVIS